MITEVEKAQREFVEEVRSQHTEDGTAMENKGHAYALAVHLAACKERISYQSPLGSPRVDRCGGQGGYCDDIPKGE